MIKYENRPYKCTFCQHMRDLGTNHIGNTYVRCPRCRSTADKICMLPEAVGVREAMSIIPSSLTVYQVKQATTADADYLRELREHLAIARGPVFEHHTFSLVRYTSEYFEFLEHHQGPLMLMSNPVTPSQWFHKDLGRLHVWFEFQYPNKDYVSGYYLDVTDEMRSCVFEKGVENSVHI